MRVPFRMNYKFTHKKLTPFVAAGITLNFRLKETEYENTVKFFGYFKDFPNNHNYFVQTSFLFHLN